MSHVHWHSGVAGMTLVEKYGAAIGREGHDESVGLGFLSSNPDIVDDIQRILGEHNIPVVASERSREAHWESGDAANL